MIFKPYKRRILKYTRVDNSTFFKIEMKSGYKDYWCNLTEKEFSTFGGAAVWVRNYDLQQKKKSEVVRVF
ncbi:MAG: hypothetical protein ACYSUK_11135 [Planctomycetota bacterium]|jgi:hypothetical protein